MGTVGLVITALSGVAILAIGVLYLARPLLAAQWFGLRVLPPPEAAAWLRVKGVRDFVCGIVAGVMLLTLPGRPIGWLLLAFALIPIGDALTVLGAGGSRARALGIHGATAALMVVGALLLILGA